jgi:peptide/nickel transport system permease protein
MALLAIVFALVISLPFGIYAARHQNQTGDVTVMFCTQLGLATPEFWFGILLTLLFSVQLGWFSAGGFPGWSKDFWGSLKALLLPAFALGVIRASILTRLTRSSMLEVLREDYVRTARAKGLKERTVVYVYFLPGLGRLVFNAIGQRDLPVVRDIVLFMAAAVVLVNFIVDMAYAWLDPRIRLE